MMWPQITLGREGSKMSIRGVFSKISNQYKLNGGVLSFGQKFTLALPGPAAVLGSIMIHNTLMKYYTDIIGINPVYIGWIYFIYNIWNAINDPLFGVYVDHFKYRKNKGKYVYLMRVTAPIMMLSIVGMLFASPDWSDVVIFALLLIELFLFDTAYTVYSVAYQSYFLIAAPTLEERIDVEVIRSYVGNVIGFLATLIPTMLLVGNGNRMLIIPIFIVVVAINAVLLVIALRKVSERPEMYESIQKKEEPKNFREVWRESVTILKSRPFLTYLLFFITARGAINFYFTPFLYYMDKVVCSSGLVATIADVVPGLVMLAILPMIGSMIKKHGSKNMILIAYIPALVGFAGLLFIQNAWYAVVCYSFIVLSLYMIQTAGVAINGALIDENEMRTGMRKTGLFNGLFALFTTTLTSLQSIIFTSVISWYGYDGTLEVQTEQAVMGIRIGTAVVPIIFCVLGLIPLLLFPINKKREQELSEFSAEMRRNGAGEENE